MNFGPLRCVPSNPVCYRCSFQGYCRALREDRVVELPVRKKSIPKKERSIHLGFYMSQGKIAIFRNSSNDIWRGLYMLPKVEKEELETSETSLSPMEIIPWVLTHLNLKIHIYELFEYAECGKEYEYIEKIEKRI